MYYPCSENKDADQLRGYREADLRLCFSPCKLLVFSRTGSNIIFLWNFQFLQLKQNLHKLTWQVFVMSRVTGFTGNKENKSMKPTFI